MPQSTWYSQPLPGSGENTLQIIDALDSIGINGCNMQTQRLITQTIAGTGKQIRDLTIGEVADIIKAITGHIVKCNFPFNDVTCDCRDCS